MNNHHIDFTADQAGDLARHFLGPGWIAMLGNLVVGSAGPYNLIRSGKPEFFSGPTWRAAFRAAGIKLPYRIRYASVGPRVLLGADQVAVCRSANFAVRTAAALNAYEPDARGQ